MIFHLAGHLLGSAVLGFLATGAATWPGRLGLGLAAVYFLGMVIVLFDQYEWPLNDWLEERANNRKH
jgi:hypothetical protein